MKNFMNTFLTTIVLFFLTFSWAHGATDASDVLGEKETKAVGPVTLRLYGLPIEFSGKVLGFLTSFDIASIYCSSKNLQQLVDNVFKSSLLHGSSKSSGKGDSRAVVMGRTYASRLPPVSKAVATRCILEVLKENLDIIFIVNRNTPLYSVMEKVAKKMVKHKTSLPSAGAGGAASFEAGGGSDYFRVGDMKKTLSWVYDLPHLSKSAVRALVVTSTGPMKDYFELLRKVTSRENIRRLLYDWKLMPLNCQTYFINDLMEKSKSEDTAIRLLCDCSHLSGDSQRALLWPFEVSAERVAYILAHARNLHPEAARCLSWRHAEYADFFKYYQSSERRRTKYEKRKIHSFLGILVDHTELGGNARALLEAAGPWLPEDLKKILIERAEGNDKTYRSKPDF